MGTFTRDLGPRIVVSCFEESDVTRVDDGDVVSYVRTYQESRDTDEDRDPCLSYSCFYYREGNPCCNSK